MILPMKKATLVVLKNRSGQALHDLRSLGLLHVHTFDETSPAIQELRDEKNLLEKALSVLGAAKQAEPLPMEADPENALELAESIVEKNEQLKSLKEEIQNLQRELLRLEEWSGTAAPEIDELREAGIPLHFLELPPDRAPDLPKNGKYFVVKRGKSMLRLAAFLEKEQIPAEFQQVSPPSRKPGEVEKDLAEKNQRLFTLEKELLDFTASRPLLQKAISANEKKMEFAAVTAAMGQVEDLSWISGFLPEERVAEIREAARKNGWALLLQAPGPADQVPTEVRNRRWIDVIKPVFQLLGTVPGYREYDISFFFLLFFGFFFAVIIGDAGYGAVLLGGTLFFAGRTRTGGGEIPPAVRLMLLMSTVTILWGALTGTWFGSKTLAELPVLAWMTIPAIATFNPASAENIKFICFVVGTLQISIAHIWNFLRQSREKPFIRSLAQLGWLFLVLGLFYLVLSLVLDSEKYPLPVHASWMMMAGLIFIIVFSRQEGRFLHGVAMGFANLLTTFLSSISAFSDIISYIRLFAVGLATVEIAKSFNEMAAGVGGGLIGIIAGSLVLLLGHSLNLAMGALSVVVHGVRLNMLEFSGHLGMEWTGRPYKPFKE